MHENKAKIVSLVPSWTETLLRADLNVVGRTRFCIHPAEQVKNIQVVGGTKSLNISELLALKPDYVLLDREENKKEMAEQLEAHNVRLIVSHVESVESAADFLKTLAIQFKSDKLQHFADMYAHLYKQKSNLSVEKFFENSVLQKNSELDFKNMNYVIWKNPYMVIGPNTFIQDVFNLFGLTLNTAKSQNLKYPEVTEEELKQSYCLFSSEPFPFHKHVDSLNQDGFRYAILDGEKISWYGIRNLNFLLSCLVGN